MATKKNSALEDAKKKIAELEAKIDELNEELDKADAAKEAVLDWLGLADAGNRIEKIENARDEESDEKESDIRDIVEDILGSASISI